MATIRDGRIVVACSWCHGLNSQNGLDLTPYCIFCGHRADLARVDCDCPKCKPAKAEGR